MTAQTSHPDYDHVLELMADMITGDISHENEAVLTNSLNDDPALADTMLEMELAATSADLALSGLADDQRDAETFTPRLTGSPEAPRGGAVKSWMVLAGVGWAAAAAMLIAVLVQFAGTMQQDQTPAQIERVQFMQNHEDAVELEWNDWALEGQPPEIQGVQGDVVWSDEAQTGYMRFVGLPQNDPGDRQYQLWIVDAERGMSQRISGGVFNADESGEIVIPIDDPEIPVNEAAAFALTIEKPGGVWVSDMSRRVVIASK